ncbi:MAG: aminotransferase class III-fold pyridoxal phosphate-dependent enzyme [Gemmatimonadales bacterium]|nr:aminotransferase class III-fold pyridoxal phosphate-dependent enzyme [Gemmatimonadales bacterium]
MTTVQGQAIRFSLDDARAVASDRYGVTGPLRVLAAERDQNFRVDDRSGHSYILKIAARSDRSELLAAQNAVLEHLARVAPELGVPRVIRTKEGEDIAALNGPGGGERQLARLLSYVPGRLLVELAPHTPELLTSFGAFFGRLDRALAELTLPELSRGGDFHWDLQAAGAVIDRHIGLIDDPARRSLVGYVRTRFETIVAPVLPSLRQSLIHNDGNDYNVLVTDITTQGGRVSGVIDFGDMVETSTVFEPAVAAAYAILGKTDPVAAAAWVVSGYHGVHPLTEQEIGLLYDLIALRLAVSVCLAAHQRRQDPENAYLSISEAPAWEALERWRNICPRLAHYSFRQAAGLPPGPRGNPVADWLAANASAIGPVVGPDLATGGVVVFDLSPASTQFTEAGEPSDQAALSRVMFGQLQAAGTRVGVGRYDEPRRLYTADQFCPPGSEVEEWRTVHLGMDLFLEPGSPVFAPLDATVHSFGNNGEPLDYGPTVILRHQPHEGPAFFTLYGHLSAQSLDGLKPGKPIAKGQQVGRIGDIAVNGGWPPHLHFQIITDLLDQTGNFPGVAAAKDRTLWRALCPDPNLVLRIPDVPTPAVGRSPEEILDARHRQLGPTLSVAYDRPLKIVRGRMQYLYDHLGREYLDGVNNVCHVGHCHPVVVEAAERQMSVLNTNTRYLHDALIEYTERLLATLPDPLRVCYLVCSGSEANELALRMARAHTNATDVIVLDGGYHGTTSRLIDISPYKFFGPGGEGAPDYVHVVPTPDCYRGLYRDPTDAGRHYASHVAEATLEARNSGKRVAAFIAESFPSCAGQIVLAPGFLTESYRLVRETGGVCIADEIQVGFGRVGSHFWGFETQGVVPDIVTMGKPIGNGHPLAAVVTTPEIAASFDTGMEYFNTFGGNPVSCAVGLAVLDVMERDGLQEHARTVGASLKHQLQLLAENHQLIGDVRGEGFFLGVELVRDRVTLEPAGPETAYVANRMRERGLLLSTDGPYENVLKLKPPMVFSEADAARLVAELDRILGEPRLRALRAEDG